MRHYILYILAVLLWVGCSTSKIQDTVKLEPKSAVIKADSAFNDKIDLPLDDQGQSLNVSIAFNEKDNILTLKVAGSRPMIGFLKNTEYKKVFKKNIFRFSLKELITFRWGSWFRRDLQAEKLDYPVLVQPYQAYTIPGSVVKSFNKKRKDHLFNSWVTAEGADLKFADSDSVMFKAPGSTLVNDTLTRHFSIGTTATTGTITLRNILTVDPVEKKKLKMYKVAFDKDLRQVYNLTIQRDPCFYTAAETDSINALIPTIKSSYKNLKKGCPDGLAKSHEEVGVFNQHRQYLLAQFHTIEKQSDCPDLQAAYDGYNAYVDSIKTAECQYIEQLKDDDTKGLNSQTLLNAARRLDTLVSQILLSDDPVEIRDLTSSGRSLIRNLNDQIEGLKPQNEEQEKALKAYRKAQTFFNTNTPG